MMDLSKVRPGDICFQFHPWSPLSEIIAYYTFPVDYNGVAHHLSHAEIIVDVGNDIQVVSADAGGMTLKWEILDNIPFWIIKTCSSLTPLQRDEIVRWTLAHQGVGYNFLGLLDFPLQIALDQKDCLYCSQACFDAYELVVDEYFRDPKCEGLKLLSGVLWVSPAHLYTSPYLVNVTGS
jgi:uncharacterized protein YycO